MKPNTSTFQVKIETLSRLPLPKGSHLVVGESGLPKQVILDLKTYLALLSMRKIPLRTISPGELETLAILTDESTGPELLKRIKEIKHEGLLTNTTPLKDAKKELLGLS